MLSKWVTLIRKALTCSVGSWEFVLVFLIQLEASWSKEYLPLGRIVKFVVWPAFIFLGLQMGQGRQLGEGWTGLLVQVGSLVRVRNSGNRARKSHGGSLE